jgi:lipid II:glycine glycyltransferase (peptidoglycan interpeptide bridge formation enzyme)
MRYRDRVVGGGVLLFDQQAVHTFQSAIDRNVKIIYPHAVFNALAIEQAEARGLRYVNFGGINAGNEGLRQYKQAWGAVATPVTVVRWQVTVPPRVKRAVCFVSNLIRR